MMPDNPPLEPIVPNPRCPHCAKPQELDQLTYAYYKGQVRCGDCKGDYEVNLGDVFETQVKQEMIAGMPMGAGKRERVRMTNGGITLLSQPRALGDFTLLLGLSTPPVPEELYHDFQDAVTALATSPPRFVAVGCRYIVQRALILKQIPDMRPEDMINKAKGLGLLSEMGYRNCMAAVFLGGKGGHPSEHWTEQIGPDEAKEAVLVTKRVLLELFNPSAVKDEA